MSVTKQKNELFKLCVETTNKLKEKGFDEDTATGMVTNTLSLCNSTDLFMIKLALESLIEIA